MENNLRVLLPYRYGNCQLITYELFRARKALLEKESKTKWYPPQKKTTVCLVPNLSEIMYWPFYWGKIDRSEAERLLAGKPDGTFLIRDSAHGFPFIISFRQLGNTLHIDIQQWDCCFGFFTMNTSSCGTYCRFIKHYMSCDYSIYFHVFPCWTILTQSLNRNFVFSLRNLCRAKIVDKIKYDDVDKLPLPELMRSYLKEYDYNSENVNWDIRNREY